jgi:hypothetical protein
VGFTVVSPSKGLVVATTTPPTAPSQTSVVVPLDSDGLAKCDFYLDAVNPTQQVTACLLDPAKNEISLPVIFNANLSLASQVAYNPAQCPELTGIRNVQDAIDKLCKRQASGGCAVAVGEGEPYETLDAAIHDLLRRGRTDICLCLLPGDQVLPKVSWEEVVKLLDEQRKRVRLKIIGCGPGTRVELNKPLLFPNLESFILRDLEIYSGKDFATGQGKGAIVFDRCNTLVLESCRIDGVIEDDKALFVIEDPNSVRFQDNIMVACSRKSLDKPLGLFKKVELAVFIELFEILDFKEFRKSAFSAGIELGKKSPQDREKIQQKLEDVLKQTTLSLVEDLSYKRFIHGLSGETADPGILTSLLVDIRLAAIKTSPGTAIILEGVPIAIKEIPLPPADQIKATDEDDYVTLKDNQITGAVGIYGSPSWVEVKDGRIQEIGKALKEMQENGLRGFMGSLRVHGNQLTRLLMRSEVISDMEKIIQGTKYTGLYGRCLFTENVVEGQGIQIMAQHVVVNANHFSLSAMPLKNMPLFGTTIADTAVLLGNCGRGKFQEASRKGERVANIEITFAP